MSLLSYLLTCLVNYSLACLLTYVLPSFLPYLRTYLLPYFLPYLLTYLVGGLEHFFIFQNVLDNPSHWRICFKMVKTTNQLLTFLLIYLLSYLLTFLLTYLLAYLLTYTHIYIYMYIHMHTVFARGKLTYTLHVENPPVVDHFPRETLGFTSMLVCRRVYLIYLIWIIY